MATEPNWAEVRKQFPALANWTYLNTATYGQTPARAVEAMARHLAHRDELACSDFLSWFDDADRLRGAIGRLIGCRAEDVAFLATAAQALSLLIGGIDWVPGDRVLTARDEFPNNVYYPALLAGRGVEFVEVPACELIDAIDERTRLVAVSTVSYVTGRRPDCEALARRVEKSRALLYVDGTQSVGALRMDAARLRPAMMAVDAYKWMLTPNGAGFVYVDPDVRRWLQPNVVGWRSHRDWRSVDNLHHGAPDFPDAAEKYEGGMLPFPALYALEAAVEMMLELGPEAIERRVLALASECQSRLESLGAEVAAPGSPVISARWAGRDSPALARALREQRVLASARHGWLRLSTHFYNNEEDLDRLEILLRRL
ncbi:MAG: aminotransferase class V-fold PLP-dependent enzyme [Bryobacteraceae bacterium]